MDNPISKSQVLVEPLVINNKNLNPKNIFQNKNFMLNLIGEFISLFGNTVFVFALGWHVLSTTKSGMQMGTILMLGIIPNILLSPFMGIVADKQNRRNIMVIMNIISGIIVLLLAIMIYLDFTQMWIFYVAVFLISICSSVFTPAAYAIIPNLVATDQLAKANAMNQIVFSLCTIIGLVLGGLFYDSLGLLLIVILNALSFFIAAFLEAFIKLNFTINNKTKAGKSLVSKIMADIQESIAFVKNKKNLLFLMLMFSIANLILDPIAAICIPYIFNVLIKSNSSHLAIVEGAFAVGSLLGAIIIPKISKKTLLRTQLLISMLLLSIVAYSMAIPALPVFLQTLDIFCITIIFAILSFFNGIGITLTNIPITVYYYKVIPDNLRGRILGLLVSSAMISIPIGFFLGGYLVQKVNMYILMITAAIFLTLITIIMVKNKSLKQMDTI